MIRLGGARRGIRVVSPSGPHVDPDAQAYFDAIVSAGSTISAGQQAAVNSFVVASKAHGYWSNMLDCSPFCGANLTGAKVKLKTGFGTSSSLANTGFVNGDYTPTTGIQGGSGKILKTGVLMDDVGPNGGLSFFIPNKDFSGGGITEVIMGATYADPQCSMLFFSNVMNAGWGFHQTWTPGLGTTPPFGFGLYRASSSNSTSHQWMIGDTILATSATSSTTDRAAEICLFADAVFGFELIKLGCWYGIDDGQITGQKAIDFSNDMLALQLALGRTPAALTVPQNFVVMIGQSLSIGENAGGLINNAPISANNNRMQTGGSPEGVADETAPEMANLVKLTGFVNEYPGLSFAALLSTISGSHDNDVTISDWGKTGTALSGIQQGTVPYNNSLSSTSKALALNGFYNTGFRVPAILMVHGESDYQNASYQSGIETLQTNYQTDLKSITGQSGTIPILHSQPSSWTAPIFGLTTALSPFEIVGAWKDDPTKATVVCPKYFLPYSADGVHLTKEGYAWLGEYYAKAYNIMIVGAGTWNPLYPTTIGRVGAIITLSFANRVGNIVLDDSITNPGNFGFEYDDDAGPSVSIAGVNVVSNQIIVTLSGTPTGGHKRIRYAYTGVVGNNAGPTTGPRGCLRDSDTTVTSLYGNDLFNWCLHFDEPCP